MVLDRIRFLVFGFRFSFSLFLFHVVGKNSPFYYLYTFGKNAPKFSVSLFSLFVVCTMCDIYMMSVNLIATAMRVGILTKDGRRKKMIRCPIIVATMVTGTGIVRSV